MTSDQSSNLAYDRPNNLKNKIIGIWELHNGPENLKKSRPKKLVNSTETTSQKIYLTKIHFLQFQKWLKNQFLNWEKV